MEHKLVVVVAGFGGGRGARPRIVRPVPGDNTRVSAAFSAYADLAVPAGGIGKTAECSE